jgi:hypothetical protein
MLKFNHELQIFSYPDSYFRQEISLPKMPPRESLSIKLAEEARTLARSISNSTFSNLDEYPFLYFTAGVSEAIDLLVPQQDTLIEKHEYRYLQAFSNVSETSGARLFKSYPFSGTGKFDPIENQLDTILDCSYIFASNMKCEKILPNNIKYVLYGLGKSHNLQDARIGWFFSKHMIRNRQILQYEYGYINSNIHTILRKVADHEPNFFYLKYRENFSSLYHKHNLYEQDVNLFATSKSGKRIPYYTLT